MKYILLLCFLTSLSFSQAKALAIVIKAKGSVTIETNGKQKKVKRGTRIYHDDLIKTKKKSYVAMRFLDDKSLVRVRQNSAFKVRGKREGNTIAKSIDMEIGNIFASITKQKSKFRVSTPTSVASVKGTVFECLYDPVTGDHITATYEGLVGVNIKGKEVDAAAGNIVIAKKDGTFETEKLNESNKKKFGINPIGDDDAKAGDEIEIDFKGSEGTKKLKIKVIDN